MFKFDFNVDEEEEKIIVLSSDTAYEGPTIIANSDQADWYDAEEVQVPKDIIERIDVCKLNSVLKTVGSVSMRFMVSGFLLEDIKENDDQETDIRKAEEMHSDLIPAVYEGGAKVWECTDDLLRYLSENFTQTEWEGKAVLDLGCGSGLLGIYCLKNGANVTFQDYNKGVLERITIPNVLLNASDDTEDGEVIQNVDIVTEKVRFYSGDWAKWSASSLSHQLYDVILTSETIYNPQNQQKLLNCLCDAIKPNGRAFVAAKSYYFGVGGGLRQFEKLIKNHGKFESKQLWMSTEGVNREIIELTKIKS